MKLSGKKGQSSLEMIVGIVFLLLVFTLITFLAFQKNRESILLKSVIDAKKVVKSFATDINVISEQGSSYFKYISLPDSIYQNFNYSLSVYGTWAEISWDSDASPLTYSVVTSNVTIYCLDKGLDKKNKIFNEEGKIKITCYRPDLKPVLDSLNPTQVNTGEEVNLSVKIKNYGVIPSGEFIVSFNSTQILVTSLGVEEITKLKINYTAPPNPGTYNIPVIVDLNDEVYESVETDNSHNFTLTVL